MHRLPILLLAWFLAVSASGPVSPLDVNETGRVMATLNDWRALMLVMLVLIALLISSLLWAFNKLASAIEVMATMRSAITTLSETAKSAGIDARDNHNTLQGIVATISRIEADLARRQM